MVAGGLHKGDGDQATDLVEGTDEAELGTLWVLEVVVPYFEVLDAVEQHAVGEIKNTLLVNWHKRQGEVGVCLPIITSSSRGNAEHTGVKVERAETGVRPPVDLLELGSFLLGLDDGVRLGLLVENAHGGWLVGVSLTER